MAERKTNVVKQASFLMAAQMISSVVGLLYKSPLDAIIGDIGDGYYSYANDWYIIILLISSYSIPSAVSKVMAERLAKKEYHNAQKVFHAALIYAVLVGIVGASVAYFGAPLLLSTQPDAVLALRVLAPTIFLSGILGVLRGFFQAHNTMQPTAMSQIAEQILNAIVSVTAAWFFTRPFIGDPVLTGKFGAAGGTLGTGAGVVTGLLFMIVMYQRKKREIRKKLKHDQKGATESYRQVFRVILLMMTPILISTCVYNVTSVVDQVIFTNLEAAKGISSEVISSQYGLFGYKVLTIINIPIALASATSTALIPAIATSIAEEKRDEAVKKIDSCIRMTLFISIPSCFGIGILSYPVIRLIYPSGDVRGAAILLSAAAISVIFYSLSTVMNGVLQGLGHPSVPVRNGLIALGVNIAVVAGCVWIFNMGVMSIVLSIVGYSLTIMLLDLHAVSGFLDYRVGGRGHLRAPFFSSCVMGCAIAAVYWIPFRLLRGAYANYFVSALTVIAAVLIGILVFVVCYFKLTKLTDEEIYEMPMGVRIVKVLRKLRLR